MARLKSTSFLAAAVGLSALASAQEAARPFALMVGDPAPPMTVSKWVKGEPVKTFEKGKVYVVEFWATWCGPCKVSIPHLTETQKKLKGKATIVGVSIWEDDRKKVEPFVKTMGDKMDYVIAMDKLATETTPGNEGAMAKTWMEASGRNGIPSAFIVDQQGTIAWMGHPMEMDEPLQKVVAGTWDSKAFMDSKTDEMAAAAKMTDFQKRFKEARTGIATAYDKAISIADEAIAEGGNFKLTGYSMKFAILAREKKDSVAALKLTDEMIADESVRSMGASLKFNYLLMDLKDFDAAYAHGRKAAEEYYAGDANMLNSLAWTIVDPVRKPVKLDLDLALMAAEKSVGIEKNAYNVDTLARVWFMKGDKAKAIKFQKEAIELAVISEKAGLQETLKEYEKS